jgi:hypothetical protein
MDNQPKPRLATVAKKNTTDRASKLAQSFVPAPPPIVTPALVEDQEPVAVEQTAVEQAVEKPTIEANPTSQPVAERVGEEPEPVIITPPELAPTSLKPVAKERRTKTASANFDVAQMLTMAGPEGLRCNRPTMLAEEHHDWLRELSFRQKKPMTVLLYNLLETMRQAYQQQNQTE